MIFVHLRSNGGNRFKIIGYRTFLDGAHVVIDPTDTDIYVKLEAIVGLTKELLDEALTGAFEWVSFEKGIYTFNQQYTDKEKAEIIKQVKAKITKAVLKLAPQHHQINAALGLSDPATVKQIETVITKAKELSASLVANINDFTTATEALSFINSGIISDENIKARLG